MFELNHYLDEWQRVLNLSSLDPSEDLVKFFNKFIQEKSQAIYDKLVELTHLKNRPKELVDHNIIVEYQRTIRDPLRVVIIPLRSGHNIKITTEDTQETIKWQYLSNNASLNVNEDKTASIEEVDSSLYQNSLKYHWIRWFLSETEDGDKITRMLCETQGSRGLTKTCQYLLQHKTDFQKYVVEHFKVEGQKFTKSQEIFDFVADNDQYEPRLNQVFFDFILNEVRNGNKQIITFHKMVGNKPVIRGQVTIDKSDIQALIPAVKNEFPELQDKIISVKLYYSRGSHKKTLYIEEGNPANGYLRTWLNEKDIHYKVNALIGDMLKVTVTGENNESRTIKTSTIHSISEFISQVKVAFGIQEQRDKCLILVPTSMKKEKLNYPAKIEAEDIISDNDYYNKYSDCGESPPLRAKQNLQLKLVDKPLKVTIEGKPMVHEYCTTTPTQNKQLEITIEEYMRDWTLKDVYLKLSKQIGSDILCKSTRSDALYKQIGSHILYLKFNGIYDPEFQNAVKQNLHRAWDVSLSTLDMWNIPLKHFPDDKIVCNWEKYADFYVRGSPNHYFECVLTEVNELFKCFNITEMRKSGLYSGDEYKEILLLLKDRVTDITKAEGGLDDNKKIDVYYQTAGEFVARASYPLPNTSNAIGQMADTWALIKPDMKEPKILASISDGPQRHSAKLKYIITDKTDATPVNPAAGTAQ